MIAILSNDTILTKMLQLEVKRGGFSLTDDPTAARIWLLDLTNPPRARRDTPRAAFVIGFSRDGGNDCRADLVFPLPYPTNTLQEVLRQYTAEKPLTQNIQLLPQLALVGNRRVALSPAEERLLSLLLQRRGEAVTGAELLAALGDHSADSNVLQVHLYRLRRKLSGGGASPIRAVRGVGYRLTL